MRSDGKPNKKVGREVNRERTNRSKAVGKFASYGPLAQVAKLLLGGKRFSYSSGIYHLLLYEGISRTRPLSSKIIRPSL